MKKFFKYITALTVSIVLVAVSVLPAFAVAPWNVTGNYEITFFLDPDTSVTPYVHHATLAQSGTSVTGDGGYPATGGDTYHWTITAGTQTGDSLNLTMVYDLGATGTMNMLGTIAPDGTVSGTWTDNVGGPRSGTWSITKGVSVPLIHTPANGAIVTQAALVKVDWTDSIGSNPPFEYMYEAFTDAGYTTSIYVSGWLSTSEIPTPGTGPGDYYLRVKAKNALSEESAWSNGAGNAHKITVTANPVNSFPVPAECNQAIAYNLIEGTSASDALNGTSGSDLILAKGGSDSVNGRGGDDCIVGGAGSDSLQGGDGNDVILGQGGSDYINGGNGNDTIRGGADSDYVVGGGGDDDLNGQAGSDAAQGGGGTDTCNAEYETQCEI
jgi:Ca2+-binding RTX toxin-like protein